MKLSTRLVAGWPEVLKVAVVFGGFPLWGFLFVILCVYLGIFCGYALTGPVMVFGYYRKRYHWEGALYEVIEFVLGWGWVVLIIVFVREILRRGA